jgi:hypothetical protein
MTLRAAHPVAIHRRYRIQLAFYLVMLGGVTLAAAKVGCLARHVNIYLTRTVEKGFLEVAMLHVVAPAAKKVTSPAVCFLRLPNMLRHFRQVYRAVGHTCPARSLDIFASVIMTYQAVHVNFFGKVKVLIFPPVADVTAVARLFAPFYSNTEIIEDGAFT